MNLKTIELIKEYVIKSYGIKGENISLDDKVRISRISVLLNHEQDI